VPQVLRRRCVLWRPGVISGLYEEFLRPVVRGSKAFREYSTLISKFCTHWHISICETETVRLLVVSHRWFALWRKPCNFFVWVVEVPLLSVRTPRLSVGRFVKRPCPLASSVRFRQSSSRHLWWHCRDACDWRHTLGPGLILPTIRVPRFHLVTEPCTQVVPGCRLIGARPRRCRRLMVCSKRSVERIHDRFIPEYIKEELSEDGGVVLGLLK